MRKVHQYELTTSFQEQNEMPYVVFAKNRKEALKQFKQRKRRGERMISLVRSW